MDAKEEKARKLTEKTCELYELCKQLEVAERGLTVKTTSAIHGEIEKMAMEIIRQNREGNHD